MSLRTISTIPSSFFLSFFLTIENRCSSCASSSVAFSTTRSTLEIGSGSMTILSSLSATSVSKTSTSISGRPMEGSVRKRLISAWTSRERKFPWMVLTPLGGWAGMISIPMMRPNGFVRSTATYVHVHQCRSRVYTSQYYGDTCDQLPGAYP